MFDVEASRVKFLRHLGAFFDSHLVGFFDIDETLYFAGEFAEHSVPQPSKAVATLR